MAATMVAHHSGHFCCFYSLVLPLRICSFNRAPYHGVPNICLVAPEPRPLLVSASAAGERVESSTLTNDSVNLLPLQKAIEKKDGDAVKEAMNKLREAGWGTLWNSQPSVSRRSTFIRELTTLGIKNAEKLGAPSVRDDVTFLLTVVGSTSLLAILASRLPGDWGFFVPYLIGSISFVVLAVGSLAPGLLQAGTVSFSSFFEDNQDRVIRHEAAHFLVAYLLGVPIVDYSLDIGKEHVNLVDEQVQKRIYEGKVDAKDLDRLAVVAMAGLAAESLKYDKVTGQAADLLSLQRLINRSKPPLSKEQQQNLTRWAVLFAASLLKNKSEAHESLMGAMSKKSSVFKCIQEIENASPKG